MKKLTLSSENQFENTDLIEVIHNVAKHNGSSQRINLSYSGKCIECEHGKTFSNNTFTKGYFAVLYLIDCLNNSNIAFTSPTGGYWFRIYVNDAPRLIDYLLK